MSIRTRFLFGHRRQPAENRAPPPQLSPLEGKLDWRRGPMQAVGPRQERARQLCEIARRACLVGWKRSCMPVQGLTGTRGFRSRETLNRKPQISGGGQGGAAEEAGAGSAVQGRRAVRQGPPPAGARAEGGQQRHGGDRRPPAGGVTLSEKALLERRHPDGVRAALRSRGAPGGGGAAGVWSVGEPFTGCGARGMHPARNDGV